MFLMWKAFINFKMFENIIGQNTIKSLFSNLVYTGKVGHGYVFNGPLGVGRKHFAYELAKVIMCMNPRLKSRDDIGACGYCDSCRLINAGRYGAENGNNPDLIYIAPLKGKDSISVEAIRDMQQELITAPLYSNKKIIMIDVAEKMTVQAQNCLLKTLEEPPFYVIIIMICANMSLILETIKSRSVKIDFVRYSKDEIVQAFKMVARDISETASLDESFVISYADGIIGRVMDLKDGQALELIRNSLFEMICSMPDGMDSKNYLSVFEKNKDKDEYIFYTLLAFYRDILMCAKFGKGAEIQNKNKRLEIFEMSSILKATGAYACIDIIDEAWKRLGRNVNYKLCIETMLIRLQEESNG